ncbi:murein L,D-transpeptidase catalytic domain family protein [Hymenobacter sp. DG25A]|uniref:murein L,D-transpeptidase catalytic domain family protein n=1 Tax=Hymenobacter sp. DG25A TaxID=1385663 RepID=UPI0006C84E87|nr:murein L,D-transpeptidase catalytic domain family protein [Hymenobacter sp. DG25A]
MRSMPTVFASLFFSLLTLSTSVSVTATETAAYKPSRGNKGELSDARRMMYLAAFEEDVVRSYVAARLTTTGLQPAVYRKALLGYYNLQQRNPSSPLRPVLTIIDFSRPSSQKRLWVIDLEHNRLLHHTLVAHGKNTGENMARTFSNRPGSEMSSVGFFITGPTYTGKHGLSLKLRGMDAAYNSNVTDRAVVVHGADYVSEQFVRQHGRLGRSQGCPALPANQSSAIIQDIKRGTVIYAHAPEQVEYSSNWLTIDSALSFFAQQRGLATGS